MQQGGQEGGLLSGEHACRTTDGCRHAASRIHQFEKVEQFFVTSPDNDASWAALEEMLTNAEDFYQALGLPYQVRPRLQRIRQRCNSCACAPCPCMQLIGGADPLMKEHSCTPCMNHHHALAPGSHSGVSSTVP